jgi:hypothetical protein
MLLLREIQQLKLLLHREVREVHVIHREMVLVHELLQVLLLLVLREIQLLHPCRSKPLHPSGRKSCVLRRIRNQYLREVCEEVRDLRGRTQSETFLRHQDVHHIELEYLVLQP